MPDAVFPKSKSQIELKNAVSVELPNISLIEQCLRELHADPEGFSLAGFLSRYPELSHPQQILLLLADQRLKWPTQQRRGPEEQSDRLPLDMDQEEVTVDLTYGAWLLGDRMSPPVIPESLSQKFPRLQEKLDRQLELHAALVSDGIQHADAECRTPAVSLLSNGAAPPATLLAQQSPNSLDSRSQGRRAHGSSQSDAGLRSKRMRNVAIAAITSCAIAALFFLPHRKQGTPDHGDIATVNVSGDRGSPRWTLEVASESRPSSWESLASRFGHVAARDLIKGAVEVPAGKHAYLYTVDATGHSSMLGQRAASREDGFIEFPTAKVQSLSDNELLLFLLVLREQPSDEALSLAAALNALPPFPQSVEDFLLVDGLPVSTSDTLEDSPSSNDELEIQNRLGSQVASRSISPDVGGSVSEFASALQTWQSSLPKELGQVHTLVVPVSSTPR